LSPKSIPTKMCLTCIEASLLSKGLALFYSEPVPRLAFFYIVNSSRGGEYMFGGAETGSVLISSRFDSNGEGAMAEATDVKAQMNQLIRGYWTTQAIYVAAELRIADQLADGPKHPDELGRLAGVNGDMLYRVLRALASIGIFAEDAEGRFMLTPLAETLCGDSGHRAYARLHGQELYQSWAKLLEAVRTGDAGFVRAFGMRAFEFFSKN